MPVPVEYEIPKNAAYSVMCIPVVAMTSITDADVVTNFTPGFVGQIVRTFWIQGTVVTTGGKGTTLNFEINVVNLVGGVITLTSALCTPLGAVINGTAVSGSNKFDRDDTISVEATSTTAFSEGAGFIYIVFRVPIF